MMLARSVIQFVQDFTANQPKPIENELLLRKEGDQLVLFVHGLSGTALGTWGAMLRIFKQDIKLKDYAFDCYAYPTSLIHLPWDRRKASIQEIANGLQTHIETHHGDKRELILVGHSLGGIIARQYILDETKCKRNCKVRGLVLFATPHTGAALASVGSQFSWRHHHLRQLCRGSDILEFINTDWVKFEIEAQTRALYIVGGSDKVVARDSAAPYLGAENVRTLIDYGHREVIKPEDEDDIRFKILKNFILEVFLSVTAAPELDISTIKGEGDVLFDFYAPVSERFYVKRQVDSALLTATQSANAWIFGLPGVGKTASLKRLVEVAGWGLQHVILDSYRGLGALDLMREVCNVLYERAGLEDDAIPRSSSTAELITYFRRAIFVLSETIPIAILIEEIPLPPGDEYTNFLDFAYHLVNATESATTSHRVIWLFSSLRNPTPDVRPGSVKLFERVQFLEYEKWNNQDINNLIDIITGELHITLSTENRELILNTADGSPRFIKMLFRRKRNELGAHKPLQEVIESVKKDLS
jgi:pimeloyl-ACP methyl ester carboxylesterase